MEKMIEYIIKKNKMKIEGNERALENGMSCLMTSAINVVRNNTLTGNERYIKKYNRRTRDKKFAFGK
ncbi:hypothetical protein [Enterococcus termitis]|uniref:Uncharacterized protein n=1 Tax=Enterococcus termitis TaxID=332950 RepID=A0A1E5GU19_9ENTE|nr:hypothetical protein [Enterococcus termitis]OEG16159.1 hypothetical protein BCR25_18360 [Enterococcus termitis]